MPNLVHVPFYGDKNRKKWVLFLSIEPGAPLGEALPNIFLGEFDDTTVTSGDNYLRTADLGKDLYAAQTRYNSPGGEEVYDIGWASNWQYYNHVPAERYWSTMSFPRKFTTREIP